MPVCTQSIERMAKSLKQVLNQISKLEREAAALKSKEVAGVVDRIREAISHYGLTVEQLFGGASKRGAPKARPARKTTVKRKEPRAPKYRDAAGNTWGGRGKRPVWFTTALASGKTAEELLIPS